MHAVIGLVAFNASVLAWGYALLHAARRGTRLGDCGLAFCAGLGALSTAACLLAVAGHVPGRPFVLVSGALLLGYLVGTHRLGGLRVPRLRRPRVPRGEGAAAALAGLVICAYAALLLRDAYVRPLAEWDAWAIWTVKAKALIAVGRLGAVTTFGVEPAYPPLVPMMQSFVLRFIGAPDSRLLHVEYALLVIAFALAVWRLVAERASLAVGAAAAVTVLLLPGLEVNVPDALADVPLAVFASLAALFLARWIADRHAASLGLFAAFGLFAGWTKNEGSMIVLALGIVAVVASIGLPLRAVVRPALAAAAALAGTAPWRLWTSARNVHVDAPLSTGLHPSYLGDRLSRAGTIAADFLRHLGDNHAWLTAPYLLVGLSAIVFATGRRRLAVFALGVPVTTFVLFVWAYMIRNDPLGVHWLLATSTSRTMMSIGLTIVVLALFELAILLRPRPPR